MSEELKCENCIFFRDLDNYCTLNCTKEKPENFCNDYINEKVKYV